jgi:hypothetical protein
MGNIKWDYGNNGRCPSEQAQVPQTGTKGSTLEIPNTFDVVVLLRLTSSH